MIKTKEFSYVEMVDFAATLFNCLSIEDEEKAKNLYAFYCNSCKKKYGVDVFNIFHNFTEVLIDFACDYFEREMKKYCEESCDTFIQVFGFNSVDEFEKIIENCFKEKDDE